MLTVFGISLGVIGCTGINVEAQSDCVWARAAPELTKVQVQGIVSSNIDKATLGALNRLDDFVEKHNKLYKKYCK